MEVSRKSEEVLSVKDALIGIVYAFCAGSGYQPVEELAKLILNSINPENQLDSFERIYKALKKKNISVEKFSNLAHVISKLADKIKEV